MAVILVLIAASVLGARASPLDRLGDAVYDVVSTCPLNGAEECANRKILDALGEPRTAGNYPLADRLGEILRTNRVVVELPDLFQGARLFFRPGRGIDFDVEFPRTSRFIDPATEKGNSNDLLVLTLRTRWRATLYYGYDVHTSCSKLFV